MHINKHTWDRRGINTTYQVGCLTFRHAGTSREHKRHNAFNAHSLSRLLCADDIAGEEAVVVEVAVVHMVVVGSSRGVGASTAMMALALLVGLLVLRGERGMLMRWQWCVYNSGWWWEVCEVGRVKAVWYKPWESMNKFLMRLVTGTRKSEWESAKILQERARELPLNSR